MALTTRPLDERPVAPSDDYMVEAEQRQTRAPILPRVLLVAQIIMFGVVALLSFAVFWMVGVVFGIF
jgi:hypothetical protein